VPDPAVEFGLSINGSLVLTGSLLRFLPGAALVSGMHDLISGAFMSGIARMAEVFLIGAAIAGAASLVLSFGERLDVDLRISISGHVGWPAVVLAAAGAIAVTFYAIRVGVPLANLAATAALGAISVVIARGLTPLSADLSRNARTLFAALAIGVLARLFSKRSRAPSVIWAVPAILPLLPAPATLLPLLAETQRAQQALQGQALQTAFVIGVGVATGDILEATYLRYRERVVTPALSVVSVGFSRVRDAPGETPEQAAEWGGASRPEVQRP
jgi:uncharacterized membrane protein YjjB (DUF3815 family)